MRLRSDLVTAPGLELSPDLTFKPYKKARLSEVPRPTLAGRSPLSISELLLHSDTHPKLDYTAREEESSGGESLLKHYIGVYDPATGELQVSQARKFVVRSTLRTDASTNTANKSEEMPTEIDSVRKSFFKHTQGRWLTDIPLNRGSLHAPSLDRRLARKSLKKQFEP